MVLMAQIEAFVEVARQGTMRQASESLHLSQPAVSARIMGLERALGARLFDRKKQGMTLTPVGKVLMPHALRALEAAEAGAASVRDFELGRAGELVIAATPAISTYVMPEVLSRFRGQRPTVRIVLTTRNSEEIDDIVLRGDAHVGLVRDHRVDYLVKEPLYSEELVLVAHRDHMFGGREYVSAFELLDVTLVLLDRRWASSAVLFELFATTGSLPVDTIQSESVELAKQLVRRGVGVAMLPMTAVATELSAGDLVRIPVKDARPVARRVLLVERPGAPAWAPLDDFRILVRRIPAFVSGTFSPEHIPFQSGGVLAEWTAARETS